MKEHTHRAPLKSMPTWETVDDWIREEIQGRFQSILEEEATAFLGRSWYERRAEVDSPSHGAGSSGVDTWGQAGKIE